MAVKAVVFRKFNTTRIVYNFHTFRVLRFLQKIHFCALQYFFAVLNEFIGRQATTSLRSMLA